MEDYDKIYNRIHERKKIEQDKPIKEKKDKKPKSEKKRSFKIINRILGLICLLMAFLIYAYKDPNAKLINQIFNTNISFEKINQFMSNLGTSLTNFFTFGTNDEKEEDIEVSSKTNFIKVSEFYYTNDDKTAYAYSNGTVISISDEETGYQIMVKHDNGYIGIYDELDAIAVKEYDRINENDKLGYFEVDFALYFIKDGTTYSYEDIVKN